MCFFPFHASRSLRNFTHWAFKNKYCFLCLLNKYKVNKDTSRKKSKELGRQSYKLTNRQVMLHVYMQPVYSEGSDVMQVQPRLVD